MDTEGGIGWRTLDVVVIYLAEWRHGCDWKIAINGFGGVKKRRLWFAKAG